MSVQEIIVAVMQDVTAVAKRERNEQGGGFMFRGIDAVMNAVGPALREHGLIVMPYVVSVDYQTVETGSRRTPMGFSRVLVDYMFIGPDGDSLTCRVAGEAMDSGDKATAKAMSVAMRTALLQTLCLPTDEPDPDSHTYTRSPMLMDDPTVPLERVAAATTEGELRAIWDQSQGGFTTEALNAVSAAIRDRLKLLEHTHAVDEPQIAAQGSPDGTQTA